MSLKIYVILKTSFLVYLSIFEDNLPKKVTFQTQINNKVKIKIKKIMTQFLSVITLS